MMIVYIYCDYKKNEIKRDDLINLCFQDLKKRLNIDINMPKILKNENGKPYFDKTSELGNMNFSISHTNNLWCMVIGSQKLGIDIQYIKKKEKSIVNHNKIIKKFFGKEEQDFLKGKNEDDFIKLWTLKEAYGKYLGIGIDKGLLRKKFKKEFLENLWENKFSVEKDKNIFTRDISDDFEGLLLEKSCIYDEKFYATLCMEYEEKIEFVNLF